MSNHLHNQIFIKTELVLTILSLVAIFLNIAISATIKVINHHALFQIARLCKSKFLNILYNLSTITSIYLKIVYINVFRLLKKGPLIKGALAAPLAPCQVL